jgi:adenosylcobinamide-GDP ribazoletransferase
MGETTHSAKISIWNSFWAAVQFLTIVPPVVRQTFTPQEMGTSLVFYPVVGVGIGFVLALFSWGLQKIFPLPLAAAFILGLWICISGAFHLDGFLDACDGLFGSSAPEKRLEIMRDKHHGTFALTGGMILLLIKWSALIACKLNPLALILSPMLARWGMTLAIMAFPYGRTRGVGSVIKENANRKSLILSGLIVLGIIALSVSLSGWIAFGVAVIAIWGIARFALSLIPGLTGDIYGAINELTELAVLLTFVICNAF